MSTALTDKEYFIGLQDWARRGGGGNQGNWLASTGFQPDPDGVWHWMDRTVEIIDSTNSSLFTNVSVVNGKGIYVHVNFPYLQWSQLPSIGDKYAYLHYVDGVWRIKTSPDIGKKRQFICEKSKVCHTCPSTSWIQFDGYCFLDTTTSNSFDMAGIICSGYGSIVATPRTDNLMVWLRLAGSVLYSDAIWIGLSRVDTISNWTWSDDSSTPNNQSPLDINNQYPEAIHTAFYQQSQAFTISPSVASNQGWKSADRSTMTSPRIICQLDNYQVPTTSTSLETTMSTTVSSTTTTTETSTTSSSTTSEPETTSTTSSSATSEPETSTTSTTTSSTTTTTTTTSTSTSSPSTTTEEITTEIATTNFEPCGDGVFDVVGEECDDGNIFNGDGCDSSCLVEGKLNY